jgi:hypothetical protein
VDRTAFTAGCTESEITNERYLAPVAVSYQFDSKTNTGRLLFPDSNTNRFGTVDLKSG